MTAACDDVWQLTYSIFADKFVEETRNRNVYFSYFQIFEHFRIEPLYCAIPKDRLRHLEQPGGAYAPLFLLDALVWLYISERDRLGFINNKRFDQRKLLISTFLGVIAPYQTHIDAFSENKNIFDAFFDNLPFEWRTFDAFYSRFGSDYKEVPVRFRDKYVANVNNLIYLIQATGVQCEVVELRDLVIWGFYYIMRDFQPVASDISVL